MELKDFKKILSHSVMDVREFKNEHFDSGFLIFFDNGVVLTAQDGEYGDNAFKFVHIEEARRFKINGIIGKLPNEKNL